MRMWREGNPLCTVGGMQPRWKTIERLLKKLEIELPYVPVILFIGIYPKNTKILIQRNACTPGFIAALSTIAKLWKQLKCPSTDEWIKKWSARTHIHTVEYYTAAKRMKSCHLQGHGWN